MDNNLVYIYEELKKFDYDTIFTTYATIYAAHTVVKGFAIKKDFKTKDINIVNIPPELKQKYDSVEIKGIVSKKIKEAVIEFADFMIETFPSSSLVNFYNNINEVKIKKSLILMLTLQSGAYTSRLNLIEIGKLSSIFHELFHLASAIYDDEEKMCYVGFRQHSMLPGGLDIGLGVNEGYTELLTQRYFRHKYNISKAYVYEVEVVKHLEKIIGQDKMESLYLNSNLPGLIDELKKYSTEEEISKFISYLDFLSRHCYDVFILKNKKITQSVVFIGEFLFRTHVSKLRYEYEHGKIDRNQFLQQFNDYSIELGNEVTAGFRKYEFLTPDSARKIVNEVLSDSEIFGHLNEKDYRTKK